MRLGGPSRLTSAGLGRPGPISPDLGLFSQLGDEKKGEKKNSMFAEPLQDPVAIACASGMTLETSEGVMGKKVASPSFLHLLLAQVQHR